MRDDTVPDRIKVCSVRLSSGSLAETKKQTFDRSDLNDALSSGFNGYLSAGLANALLAI